MVENSNLHHCQNVLFPTSSINCVCVHMHACKVREQARKWERDGKGASYECERLRNRLPATDSVLASFFICGIERKSIHSLWNYITIAIESNWSLWKNYSPSFRPFFSGVHNLPIGFRTDRVPRSHQHSNCRESVLPGPRPTEADHLQEFQATARHCHVLLKR